MIKPEIWGRACVSVTVLKIVVVDKGYKPFDPCREVLELGFPPRCVTMPEAGFIASLRLSLSYPLYCGFPFVYLMRRDCLSVFRVSLGASQVAQW